MSTAQQIVDNAIASEYIVVFGKSWCPHTKKAREAIAGLELPEGKKVKDFDLDLMGEEGEAMQAYLKTLTGQGTVPNIFIQGKHLGGNSDLQTAKDTGKLKELLVVA
ncbi:putative GRX1-glutaredoxin [Mrakia frigida]|uniref:glutaredoxin n=1 Tax=Mrakia frigida TaxID=29902 RepID=UPI003FCC0D0B